MKTLLLTAVMAFSLQSVAFAAQVHTKSCEQKFDTNSRSAKDVKSIETKNIKKSKVKSE